MGRPHYLEAFEVQKILMTLAGAWPRRDLGLWYKTYGFTMSLLLQAVFMLPSMAQVFADSTDSAHGSYILFCGLTVAFYGVKLTIFYRNRDLFYEILEKLDRLLYDYYPSEFDFYVRKAIFISVTIRKLIQLPCVFLIMFMATFPIIDGSSSKRPLPFDLPLDTNQLSLVVYVAIYCIQIFAAAICASNNLNMDTLAFSLISLGTAQLEILVENLKQSASIVKFASNNFQKTEGNPDFYRKFDREIARKVKKCAKHHIAISKYIKNVESTFTYLFLTQFLDSLIVICITGFTFFVIPLSNILFWTCLSYFVAAVLEIGIYCISGDELIIQSMKVRDACYMSEWINCGTEIRRTLFIIMERSKKPFVLTAGKFANLSRDSLVTICKSSFSYLTVLRKMYGNGK